MSADKKNQKGSQGNEDKTSKKDTVLKESTYSLCPIHNVQYPRGAKCPQCP
jgi:hypothetical protein